MVEEKWTDLLAASALFVYVSECSLRTACGVWLTDDDSEDVYMLLLH
jgi:hypothetical protein